MSCILFDLWMLEIIVDVGVPDSVELTLKNRKVILKKTIIYQLSDYRIEISELWAVDAVNFHS